MLVLKILPSNLWLRIESIIDLSPEGGAQGGKIIETGTPEEVAKNPAGYTGIFL